MAIAIPVVLITKKGTTSPIAWCLTIILVPLLGSLLFWIFGYSYLHRPLKRKQRHRSSFRVRVQTGEKEITIDSRWRPISNIGWEWDDAPIQAGNQVTLFPDTQHSFDAICDAIRAAKHHVHIEFFILRDDQTGQSFISLLTEKAKQGVQVRLLYDSLGGFFLGRAAVQDLVAAGGKVFPFLPLNLFRSRLRVNLRNHRKIVVVDGQVAFTGGMNIGDEYLCRNAKIGYWRDQMLRLEGAATEGLQRIFVEDWDFTTKEFLQGPEYFPTHESKGTCLVQVLSSGPDQDVHVLREVYYAAISSAQKRVWIATPYFIPDAGLLDALHLARYRGANVRLLMPRYRDHFSSYYASRYYWTDILTHGVQIYQYEPGMMHSKFVIVDGEFALVGSANLDPRSLQLNFEAACALYDAPTVAELERLYLGDLERSTLVERTAFESRSRWSRLAENGFRIFSPIL